MLPLILSKWIYNFPRPSKIEVGNKKFEKTKYAKPSHKASFPLYASFFKKMNLIRIGTDVSGFYPHTLLFADILNAKSHQSW